MKAIKRSRSLREDVYQSVKASIISNELRPGQQLKEGWLASQLGVSSTPLREALAKLEQEGLVATIPHRGKFVTQITPEDVKDIYEVRRALEVLAVELAVPSFPSEDMEELDALFEKVQAEIEQGNFSNYFESDSRFHELSTKNTGNQWLMGMLSGLNDHVRRIRALAIAMPGPHIVQSFREHRAILEEIRAQDTVKAKKLMSQHIQHAGARIADLLIEGQLRHEIELNGGADG